MVESSCCTQCLVFAQVNNLDLWELLGGVFDEVAKDRFFVVTNYANFLNVRNLCDSGETVPDDGMASYFEERLAQQFNS